MLATLALAALICQVTAVIDRENVVKRNTVVVTANNSSQVSPADVLVVGNGAFAFQVDITGTQSFNNTYTQGPTSYDTTTMADWGWHTIPFYGPANSSRSKDGRYALTQYNYTYFDAVIDAAGHTRSVPYTWGVDDTKGNPDTDATNWMMTNPHRLNLGQTSIRLGSAGNVTSGLDVTTLANARLEQRMWEGVLTSNFTLSMGATPPVSTCGFLVNDNTAYLTLSCGAGSIISGINNALYGDVSPRACGGEPFTVVAACNSSSAFGIISQSCLGTAFCSVPASNTLFGDPCVGKWKALAMNFTCAQTGLRMGHAQLPVAGAAYPPQSLCGSTPEDGLLTLSCGSPSHVITDFSFAAYAATLSGTCSSGFLHGNCTAASSASVLAATCLGKPWCAIPATNAAFGGDPCAGQPKTLAAVATCSPAPPPPTPTSYDMTVTTVVHPDVDAVGVRVACMPGNDTLACPLALRLAFPYGNGQWGPVSSDWNDESLHTSTLVSTGTTSAMILRVLDDDAYRVDCAWASAVAGYTLVRVGNHAFDLVAPVGGAVAGVSVELVCLYSPPNVTYPAGGWLPWLQTKQAATRAYLLNGLPSFDDVFAASAGGWADYWSQGAFVDLASNTVDPSAVELERRVVLSQYLLRVHNAGGEPPAETGLLCNSWGGKHHLEMRFWHHAHWGMWNRADLLHRSDGFYVDLLPNCTSVAAFQGYKGIRWLKETATVSNRSGIDVPWLGLDFAQFPFNNGSLKGTGPLMLWEAGGAPNSAVIWQQPHPIWLADLQRRVANATAGPSAALAVMAFHQDIVFGTADFLSSFPYFNSSDGAYWIHGPPLFGAEEMGDGHTMRNPSFEMVQFAYALDIANQWRALLGLPEDATWDAVASAMSRPPLDLGADPSLPTYSFNLDCACVFNLGPPFCPGDRYNATQCNPSTSHPSMAGMWGMINGRTREERYGVDPVVLNNTVRLIVKRWDWGGPTDGANVWGWDFPLVAMACVRLGWDSAAIVAEVLLMGVQKNSYLRNGHNYQSGSLPAYLPGNGGLLLAVSLMAAGSDTTPENNFPAAWGAQSEGFVVRYP